MRFPHHARPSPLYNLPGLSDGQIAKAHNALELRRFGGGACLGVLHALEKGLRIVDDGLPLVLEIRAQSLHIFKQMGLRVVLIKCKHRWMILF